MFPIVVVKRSMPTCFQCELAHQKSRSTVVFVYEPFYSSTRCSVLFHLRIQNQCCRYFQSIQAVTAVKRCDVCSRKTHVSRRCLTSKPLSPKREPKLEISLHKPQKISRCMPQPSSSKSNA